MGAVTSRIDRIATHDAQVLAVYNEPDKPVPFTHNPHYYVKDEVLKMGIRMHARVAMDFLTGKI